MFLKIFFLLTFQLLIQIKFNNSHGLLGRMHPSRLAVPPPPPPSPTISIMAQNCTQFSNSYDYWFSLNNSNNYCYYISVSYSSLSWHSANNFCRSKNSSLVSIHDYKTNFLLSHRNTISSDYYYFTFWIGLNSLSKRGEYKWTDGSQVEYFNFANITSSGDPIPPNILDQGRCVSFKSMPKDTQFSDKNIGLWFKDDCNTNHRFICQRSIHYIKPTTAPPQTGNCQKDWFQFSNQKCIKYINGLMTFNESRNTCIKLNGGEMLSIHSEEEQNFITAYTAGRPSPFIGLKRLEFYASWIWDDNKDIDFTNWAEQNSYYHNHFCSIIITNEIQAGKWAQTNCSEKHSIICEKPLDPKITTPGIKYLGNKCNISGFENYHQYRNSCYSIVDSDPNQFLTFSDAENACKANGSHLVSIVDPFEEAFLRYYIKQYGKSDMYWIGLQSKLSADTNVSQAFEWTDDWPVYYTNWDNYEPQFAGLPQEECVTFAKSNGTWRTIMCVSNYSYICKVTTNQMPKLNSDKSGVCPQLKNITDKSLEWIDIDKRSQYCYWFSVDRKGIYNSGVQTWVDASFHCRQRNGTLISIHSKHDLMLLKSKLTMNSVYYSYNTWIGLSSDPKGTYIWEDSSPIQFTNWDSNEKIVSKAIDWSDEMDSQCVEVKSSDLMWKQQPCSGNLRNYYGCEIKKIYHAQSTRNQKLSNKISGLSFGAKAGIAFGLIIGVVVFITIAYFASKKYRSKNGQNTNEQAIAFSTLK